MTEHDAIHSRIDNLENTLKDSLAELTDAVKTLVVLETEHKATRDTLARYGDKLERHDARLDHIEQRMPIYEQIVSAAWWGLKIVGGMLLVAIISSAAVYLTN